MALLSLGVDLDRQITALYARGASYSDVRDHLMDMYPFVWLDAIHYKVRYEGRVVNRAVYCIIGLNQEVYKELLGLYIGDSEGSKFWLQVLTDLQNRGVEDIFIACIDNLQGFAEAIESVYPQAEVQLCIVHQIRNLSQIPFLQGYQGD